MKKLLLILFMLVGYAYAQDQTIGRRTNRLIVLGRLAVDSVIYDATIGDTVIVQAPDGTLRKKIIRGTVSGTNLDSLTWHSSTLCVYLEGQQPECFAFTRFICYTQKNADHTYDVFYNCNDERVDSSKVDVTYIKAGTNISIVRTGPNDDTATVNSTGGGGLTPLKFTPTAIPWAQSDSTLGEDQPGLSYNGHNVAVGHGNPSVPSGVTINQSRATLLADIGGLYISAGGNATIGSPDPTKHIQLQNNSNPLVDIYADGTTMEGLHTNIKTDVLIDSLKTTATAPSTSGTTRPVIVDANGKLSFGIASLSGGLDSFYVSGTGDKGYFTYKSGRLDSFQVAGGTDSAVFATRARLINELALKQNLLTGTGFVKSTAGTISYDNSTYLTGNQAVTVTATGDAAGTSTSSATAPSLPLVLATVNSNVGSFTNANVTVNAKGLVTAVSNGTSGGSVSITPGVGITTSPNPITGTGSVTLDTASATVLSRQRALATYQALISFPNATTRYMTGYNTFGSFYDSARASMSLTTTGTGAATYNSSTGVWNIPTPSAGSGGAADSAYFWQYGGNAPTYAQAIIGTKIPRSLRFQTSGADRIKIDSLGYITYGAGNFPATATYRHTFEGTTKIVAITAAASDVFVIRNYLNSVDLFRVGDDGTVTGNLFNIKGLESFDKFKDDALTLNYSASDVSLGIKAGGTSKKFIGVIQNSSGAPSMQWFNGRGEVRVGGTTTNDSCNLQAPGSVSMGYTTAVSTTTMTNVDNVYTLDCTSGTFTVTLPATIRQTGRIINIVNSGAGTITIATASTDVFKNVTATPTSITMVGLGTRVLQGNGSTGWNVISSF